MNNLEIIQARETTPFWTRKSQMTRWALKLLSKSNLPLFNESRYALEAVIIPYFGNQQDFHKILFVGCAWFTRYYEKEYFYWKDYWTIEKNPRRAKYGAKQHIIDSLSNLNDYFEKGSLDLIICNGVFGWGLNNKEDVEKAFSQCYESLRTDGILIVGWNDITRRKPFPLEECQSLSQFKPYVFPGFSASQYLTATLNRHTFNFYIK